MATTVHEIKNFLKKGKSPNENLYDHLTDTLMKIVLDQRSDCYENFESISSFVKSNPFKLDRAPSKEESAPITWNPEQVDKKLRWAKSTTSPVKVHTRWTVIFTCL